MKSLDGCRKNGRKRVKRRAKSQDGKQTVEVSSACWRHPIYYVRTVTSHTISTSSLTNVGLPGTLWQHLLFYQVLKTCN
jgi:hypothetical protein